MKKGMRCVILLTMLAMIPFVVEGERLLWEEIYADIEHGKDPATLADIYIIDDGVSEREWKEAAQKAVNEAVIAGLYKEEYAERIDYDKILQEVRELRVKRLKDAMKIIIYVAPLVIGSVGCTAYLCNKRKMNVREKRRD